MAYDGGYGGQQRSYAGPAAQRPAPRGYGGGPSPQQYGAPQQYDDYQDGYSYDEYGAGGGAQNNGGQYGNPGHGGGGAPSQQGYFDPVPGRGGRPSPGGRGGGPQGRPSTADGHRGGGHPPRRGGGGMGGPGPGRGRGGGPPNAYPPNSDPSAGRRPPMSNTSPGAGDGSYAQYPPQGRRPGPGQEHQMTNQMAAMDLGGQRPNGPPGGRGPPGRGYPPQGEYPDPRRGPPPGQAPGGYGDYGDEYGSRPLGPPRNDFNPPGRSMTMQDSGSASRYDMAPSQQMDQRPYDGPGGRGVPQRPATATGTRPPPQRTYPPNPQGPPPGQYAGNYEGDNNYRQQSTSSVDDVFDSYYENPRLSNPEYGSQPQQGQPTIPDFNAAPAQRGRGSFEQTMRPGPEQPQAGPHQTPQLHHTKSLADVREPQAAIFEMAGDIPSMPPVPQNAPYQSQYDQGYGGPAGYNQMPPRGPSAPPGPGGGGRPGGPPSNNPAMMRPGPNNAPGRAPSHPTPVRPGLMPNSMVNMHDKPPPVRNYGNVPTSTSAPTQVQQPPPQRQAMTSNNRAPKQKEEPVTPQELEQLRMAIKMNANDQVSALKLAKRLIEASDALVANIPDPKARARGRERYLMDAQKILKKLSNSQNQEAMFIMADSLGRGLFGHEPDSKEAFTLYQSAAKLGNAAAAYRTAVCCEIGHEEGGGTRKDPLKAIQWYKRAATLGDPPAMYKVGMILLKGLLGQPRNPREAVGWLKRAAERADAENPHALHELGLLYESAQPNDAIVRDEGYAFTLFQEGAELGYKFSQFRLGCVFEYGLMGRPVDPRLSIVWYSRAAQQEEHQSELSLSGWYLTGSEGVLGQSDTEAYLWARKAAVAGLAKAEYAMGYFTETGIGIPPNLEDAKRWYWRAAAQDFPKARERLEDLKRAGKAGRPRQRERISRSQKQEGECTLM